MPVMRIVILLVAAAAAIGVALLFANMEDETQVEIAPIQTVEKIVETSTVVEKEVSELQVLVASADLRVGQFLSADELSWQPWPKNSNTAAFITDELNPNAVEELVGAVVRMDVMAGEPITASKYVHPGEAGFMAAVLTPGMRAVAVEISSETAAGGFIYPNDRVDVVLTYQVNVQRGEQMVSEEAIDTILHNVRVLAIDGAYKPIEAEEEGVAMVGNRATLELSQEDAMVLTAAGRKGELALTLRPLSESDGPSGSTPRSRLLASRRSGGTDGVRVFAGVVGGVSVHEAPAGSAGNFLPPPVASNPAESGSMQGPQGF